jgi:hypothetical protein
MQVRSPPHSWEHPGLRSTTNPTYNTPGGKLSQLVFSLVLFSITVVLFYWIPYFPVQEQATGEYDDDVVFPLLIIQHSVLQCHLLLFVGLVFVVQISGKSQDNETSSGTSCSYSERFVKFKVIIHRGVLDLQQEFTEAATSTAPYFQSPTATSKRVVPSVYESSPLRHSPRSTMYPDRLPDYGYPSPEKPILSSSPPRQLQPIPVVPSKIHRLKRAS